MIFHSIFLIRILNQAHRDRGCPDDLAELPYINGQSASDSTTASDLSSVVSAESESSSSGSAMNSSKIVRVMEQLKSLQVGLSKKDTVIPSKFSGPAENQIVVDNANGLPSVPNPRLVVARILQEAKARRESAGTTDPTKVATVPDFVP